MHFMEFYWVIAFREEMKDNSIVSICMDNLEANIVRVVIHVCMIVWCCCGLCFRVCKRASECVPGQFFSYSTLSFFFVLIPSPLSIHPSCHPQSSPPLPSPHSSSNIHLLPTLLHFHFTSPTFLYLFLPTLPHSLWPSLPPTLPHSLSPSLPPSLLPSLPPPTLHLCDIPSHFWVVALKVDGQFDTSRNPSDLYNGNNSFMFYSANLTVNQPYIVAEISSANYSAARDFILGSTAANIHNDFPFFVNGPLQRDTRYTVFVWGFPPIPPVSLFFNAYFTCS